MTLISRIASTLGFERRATTGDAYWSDFSAMRTGSVNPTTAQSVSAVFACVSAISETTASLPLILYRRKGDDDRERATDHPLYRVLHDMANPQQTAIEAREYLQACILLRGNAYARIVRGWDGQVRELWPLSPDKMTVLRVGDSIAYDYITTSGKIERLLSHEVLHLRHRLGDDGVMGISPIAAARGVVELAMAERDHG
ncbi:MAG: phage portal protein, partial [Burkholderiales bacterium]